MNYYEELGLTPSASVGEIRQAYKSLARLLHPDQQAEEALKHLAECQMKRLNAIYAVLGDPVQRSNYDRGLRAASENLLEEPAAAGAVRRPAWDLPRLFRFSSSDWRFALWLLGISVVAGGIFWYVTADSGRGAPAYPKSTAAKDQSRAGGSGAAGVSPQVADPLAQQVSQLRRRLEVLEAERDAARAQLAQARSSPSASSSSWGRVAGEKTASAPPLIPEPPEISGSAAAVAPSPSARVPAPSPFIPAGEVGRASAASRFAGTWFYAPPKVAPSAKTLYPPEYIEAVIVEEAGLLRGRYYARYRVTDRAISPEVIFQFEGWPGKDTAVLEWSGGGGARGEVRLKLISENSMEVNWSATELGSSPGLAAGTAVLIRRIE